MSRYTETNKKIYTTTDYELFKLMDGNRKVSNANVVKLMESIDEAGWLSEEITVNENFEVINGQHRLEALKRLGLPVEFKICKGYGKTEMIHLNKGQKNWGMTDYVNLYCAMGDENYIWLKGVLKDFSVLGSSTILSATTSVQQGVMCTPTGQYASTIKDGDLKMSVAQRKEVEDLLWYLLQFSGVIKHIGGDKRVFYCSLAFMHSLDIIDNSRLCKTILNNKYDICACSTMPAYIEQFEIVYNKNLPKANKIDAVHEYKIA